MEHQAWRTLFGALANPARLEIMDILRTGEKSVTELIQATGLSQSLVSHNLRRLTVAKLVTSRADGAFRRYELNAAIVEPLFRQMDTLTTESTRKTRERLKMTEARFRQVLAHAPSYVFIVDPKFNITYLNRTSAGHSPEEFVGKNVVDLQPDPERKKKMVAAFKKAMRNDAWASYESKGPNDTHFISWVGAVRQGRKVQDIVVMVSEITELKKAYEEKNKAESHLRLVLDHTPVIIGNLDMKGVVTLIEGEGLSRFGITAQDVIGKSMSDFERHDIHRLVQRALKGEKFSSQIESPVGAFKATFTPYRVDGKVAGVTAVAMIQ